MNRQQGKITIPYSEIMRVIGTYADQAHLAEVRVIESDDGVVLQGRQTQGESAGECETYQLTREDIETLLQDARAKRGSRA